MILIADSGSTKTEWALARAPGDIVFFRTEGFNPYFDRQVRWRKEVEEVLSGQRVREQIVSVYYYGAGCDLEHHKMLIRKVLKEIVPVAGVEVEDDMTGAARALFGRERGVAVILGTGANAGLWEGKGFISRSRPLGYLLGDHGSGAVLGLRLIRAWLDQELSPTVSKAFAAEYEIKTEDLKENIYLQGRPNHYLAGFAPFLLKYQLDKTIRNILEDEFGKLFDLQLKPLLADPEEMVRFTGSVAYYFQEHLRAAGQKKGVKIDRIVQYPLKDLAEYHLRNKS